MGPYRTAAPPPEDDAPAEPQSPYASCEDGNKKRAAKVQQLLDMLEFKGFAYPITLRASAETMRGVIQIHLALGSDVTRVFYLDEREIMSRSKVEILELFLERIRRSLREMVVEELERHATLRGGSIWASSRRA